MVSFKVLEIDNKLDDIDFDSFDNPSSNDSIKEKYGDVDA
jgi:hypothetical protein